MKIELSKQDAEKIVVYLQAYNRLTGKGAEETARLIEQCEKA